MDRNVVVVSDGRPIAAVQQGLARFLPGLDAGLVPLAGDRALMPGPLARALRVEYGAKAVPAILAAIGVTQAFDIGDEATTALLRARDVSALPSRAALRTAAVVTDDWHLNACKLPAAWALVGGPDAIDWSGVRVGQIDTGFTRHPVFGFGGATWIDLAMGRTFFAGGNPGDEEGPGQGEDPLANSEDGHGTKVGSVLCGLDPAAPGGTYRGVAPKVPLVPVRIANHPLIDHAQREFAQAVDHLVDTARVQVINLSMGAVLSPVSREMRRAVNKAYDAGAILVCAAGNIVRDVVKPARIGRTLAIAGVGPELKPWPKSSLGPEVDVSGPADVIRRAESRRGGRFRYGIGDGTSFAAAMVSGAAALWLAHRRAGIAAEYAQPWQRVEAFTTLLRANVVVPPVWNPGAFGSGVLDVEALLRAPLPAASSLTQAAPV